MSALFSAGHVLTSGRVRLSALDLEAVGGMPWLDAALAPDWRLEALEQAVAAGHGLLISDQHDLSIGASIVFLGRPGPGAAVVPVLAIDPSRRFRGLGGEAALALERYLRREQGIKTVYAPVPDGRGLAVYFWLRQGYRPLTVAAGPGPLIGLSREPRPGIWMVRERE